jgi:hypothetical protein
MVYDLQEFMTLMFFVVISLVMGRPSFGGVPLNFAVFDDEGGTDLGTLYDPRYLRPLGLTTLRVYHP